MRTVDLDLATLRCAQDGRVLTVRVEAPPFNFMTAAMQDDFVRLVAAVQADRSVGAVIVTGGVPGRYITHFAIGELAHSAGTLPASVPRPLVSVVVRAVKAISAAGGEPARRLLDRTPVAALALLARFHQACAAILRSPAVWIAAIDGPCGGGGVELSTFFDLRLATPAARFLLPELTIALSTTFGGQRLATLVGPAKALELMLDANAITAADAEAMGLVDRVVDGDLLAHAQALAARYARRPRTTVAAQKGIFNDSVTLAESLTREAIGQTVGLSSPTTRAALTGWLRAQDPSGDSTFLTDPEPWRDGTALDLNADASTPPAAIRGEGARAGAAVPLLARPGRTPPR